MKASRFLLGTAVAALVGLSIFGVLAARSLSVRKASPSEALERFNSVRATFQGQSPFLVIDSVTGRVSRSPAPGAGPLRASAAQRLGVLAYRAGEQRLVEAKAPIWFLRIKGGAAQFALRDTGIDLERLKVTPEELSQRSPGLILDETRTNGDRVLVWTE